jgi:hypothetical protein
MTTSIVSQTWLGPTVKVDWPILTNLRLDPYERTGMFNGKDNGSIAYYNWFAYEFWRSECEYRIKSANEPHERVARESELTRPFPE